MILHFIRHGQAEHNIGSLMNFDPNRQVKLTELGEQQVNEAAEKLRHSKIDFVYTSEFPRAKQTAEIINKYHHAASEVDPRINEIKSGLEGRPHSEWKKAISADPLNAKLPGGESLRELKLRVHDFVRRILLQNHSEVLIATHGECMKAIKGFFNNTPDSETFNQKIANCEMFTIRINK